MQHEFHAQCILVADNLENILLIKLRRNELDKRSGTKYFITVRRPHEVLEGSFEESCLGLGIFPSQFVEGKLPISTSSSNLSWFD